MKHMKNRVAALLLTLAMVLSLMPMAFAADFPDMPAEDDPSYAAVKSAVDNEIMTGENGMLNLEGTILRSTVSKMVVTAFAAKNEADLSSYPDVAAGSWYEQWMAKANQMGIMSGTSGKMNPSNEVTLAEVAAMLVRALGLPMDKTATLDGVAAWAAPYVKALIDAGYISAEAAADAGKPMTRAAFAEVIYNVTGKGNYVKEGGEYTTDVDGNIVITADGVSLKGITVTGDVIIADGVDAGSIVLDGVKIEGRLVVRGGEAAELKNGTTAASTVVAKTSGEVTVKADDYSDAGKISVAGTSGKAAEKVTLDMAEPNATIDAETNVAIQNAEGGEVTLMVDGASLSVESGTVANVTVADGASNVKVDVSEGATIEKVTSNEDLTVTGEGDVKEKAGSGKVTDKNGTEVAGDDTPADVPTSPSVSDPVDPNLPSNESTHVHTWGDWEPFDATRHVRVCKAATTQAEEEGEEEDEDSPCGAVQYEAHNTNGDPVYADGADPENDDPIGHACSCGYSAVVVSTITSDGDDDCAEGKHMWQALTGEAATAADDKAATCTEDGQKTYKCTKTGCTATKTDALPAKGHTYVVESTTPATCGTAGSTHFACSVEGCDDEGYDAVIPATNNHNWKLTDTDTPTCAEAGKYVYTCTNSNCGETAATKEVEIAKNANAHAWGEEATHVDGTNTHTLTCTVDGCDVNSTEEGAQAATKVVACTLVAKTGDETGAVAATCTEPGKTASRVCSVCGNEVEGSTIPATGHNWNSNWEKDASGHWHTCRVEGCEATSTKVAHPEGATSCGICGWKADSGEGGDEGGEEQPTACEHNYVSQNDGSPATCTAAGKVATEKCSKCQAVKPGTGTTIEALGHNLSQSEAAQPATCTATGKTATQACSRCNYTEGGTTIPANGHTWSDSDPSGTQCSNCDATKPS